MARIVLVMPTLMQGGAERVMSVLANEWVKKGHEVFLVLLVQNEIFYTLDEKVHCVFLGKDNYKNSIDRVLNRIFLFFKFRRFVKKEKPDFVLSFLDQYNIFVIISTLFLKLRLFVSDRSNPLYKIPFSIEILKRILYRNATGIIAQTSLARKILYIKTKHKNIQVISNPLVRRKQKVEVVRDKIILNVGRMVEEKAQHYLMDMMVNINNPDWKLVILGDGPLRSEIEAKIEKCNLNSRIELGGQVKNVNKWFDKSSIFVFSSISEGFPNALVEAMAAGLPCVSFDCDAGPRDLINDGKNGFLVPVGNIDLFSEKVKSLIDNDDLRNQIGSQAIKIQNELNVESIAEKYLDFCLK